MLLYDLAQEMDGSWCARVASDLPGPDGTAELEQFRGQHRLGGRLEEMGQFAERLLVRRRSAESLRRQLRGPTFSPVQGALEVDAGGWELLIVQAKREATHRHWADPSASVTRRRRVERSPGRDLPDLPADRRLDVQFAKTRRHSGPPTPPHPVGRSAPWGWTPITRWRHVTTWPIRCGHLDLWMRDIEVGINPLRAVA